MNRAKSSLLQLQHVHLPRFTAYSSASRIQDQLVRQHLEYKASPSTLSKPNPVLLTFQTPPTYTCGRREIGTLSAQQMEYLRADGKAEFVEALRGGQTTFHGPGQLTAFLICSLTEHKLSPRCYVHLLEESVIATCKEYNLNTQRRQDSPGVWIRHHKGDENANRKIASVGVHLRRNVSSHGIGLNVSTDLDWFKRIIACGLPGNLVTSMEKQLGTPMKGKIMYPSVQELRPVDVARQDGSLEELDTLRRYESFRRLAREEALDTRPLKRDLSRIGAVFASNVARLLENVHPEPMKARPDHLETS